MLTTKRSKIFIIATCIVTITMLIATGAWAAVKLLRPTNTVATADPIQAAWQRAHAAGAYDFDGDVTQITLPTARITNVGRASRTEQLHVAGNTNVRENALEMKLWSQGGSIVGNADGLSVKVENGKSYMRQGSTGEWKANDQIALDGIAPQGDFMS